LQTVPASDIHRITHAANRVVSHARGQLNNILAVLCFERFVFLLFRLGGFYMNLVRVNLLLHRRIYIAGESIKKYFFLFQALHYKNDIRLQNKNTYWP
jgi:hypothetical protein